MNRPLSTPSTPQASLWIHVIPRAGRTEVVGWHGDAVKIRVKAPPVDGAANEELRRFLSKTVGVPQRALKVSSGAASRRKRVTVDGLSEAAVLKALGV